MPWSKKFCCGNALKNNVQKKKSQTFKKEVFSSLFFWAFLSVFVDFFFFLSGQRVWAKAIKCNPGANSVTETEVMKIENSAVKSDLNC